MIARFLAGANMAVDARRFRAHGGDGIEQQMVDADAGVAGEGVAPIIPEGEDPLIGVELADGVGPALLQQADWARGSGWNRASSSQRSGLETSASVGMILLSRRARPGQSSAINSPARAMNRSIQASL
jgi:hypothetical protein